MEAAERGCSSAAPLAESGLDDPDPEPLAQVIDAGSDKPGQANSQAAGDDFDKVGHPKNLVAVDVPTANTVRPNRPMHRDNRRLIPENLTLP